MEKDSESTKATKPPPPGAVLLIERDSLVREGLCALLNVWGFEVHSGGDPSEALADPAGGMVPTVAVLSTPGGDAAIGVDWIAALRLRYRGLPTILVADESADGVTLSDCVHIGWPAKATSLRHALAAITSASARNPK
jgi:DNA-binding response OmpR family regulator